MALSSTILDDVRIVISWMKCISASMYEVGSGIGRGWCSDFVFLAIAIHNDPTMATGGTGWMPH